MNTILLLMLLKLLLQIIPRNFTTTRNSRKVLKVMPLAPAVEQLLNNKQLMVGNPYHLLLEF